ncbi:MAG: hypothetical protein MK008_13225 [Bdellovibrionales bacterium]|nr:hypothetical protein [Bdellovibrionales bacterium]
MKWTALASPHSQSDGFLWLDEYLNQSGHSSDLDLVTLEEGESLKDLVEEKKKQFQNIRFASDFYESSAKLYDTNPVQTLTLKVGDCLKLSDGAWWLRCYTFQALNQIISKYGTQINLEGEVLIIGGGGFSRLCASAFIRIGFKNVNLSALDYENVKGLAKDLERSYFGVKARAIPSDQLILLPGTHTVLINTLKNTEDSIKLLTELYYFNFLKQGGMVWDLNFLAVNSDLTKEAVDVGAFTLNGVELMALTDVLWLKDNFAIDIDLKSYTEFLISKIK